MAVRYVPSLVRGIRSLRPAEWLPAVGLAVLQPVATVQAADRHLPFGDPGPGSRPLDALALSLLALAPLPLVGRLRHPSAALLAVFVFSEIYLLAGYEPGPVWLALLCAFVNCVIYGYRAAALSVLAVGYGVEWLAASYPQFGLSDRMGMLAWLILLAAVGEVIRARHRYAATEAAREAEAGRVLTEAQLRRAGEERLRIAQDLHDVLAHHISLIIVQAGVGLELFDRRPGQARAALAAVKDAANVALGELREALEVLSEPGANLPRAPAPQISRVGDVDALLDAARVAGLRVRVCYGRCSFADPECSGNGGLSLLVDQAAYRILQESLTNAMRHAGPGALVEVGVEMGPTHLVLTVRDDGRGVSTGLPAGGRGIAGMHERASALGGTLSAGFRAGGGFAICASLPLVHPADDAGIRPQAPSTLKPAAYDNERNSAT